MRRGIAALLTGLVLVAAGSALGRGTPIADVELDGAGPTLWDPANVLPGNSDCLTSDIADEAAYSPVDDGQFAGTNDAFDSGLVLMVGSDPFVDGDGEGTLVGEQLTLGPETIAGLTITRIDRALSTSPTLRSLIKLQNKGNAAKTRALTIESDLGADETEAVFASSTGDPVLTKRDRWVLFADSTDPGDPPVTLVNYGKGQVRERLVSIPNPAIDGGGADSCVSFRFSVKVPKRSTRYLLLFTEMHDPADAQRDIVRAFNDAQKFNKGKLSKRLLTGLSKKVRKNVLNWKLVR